MTTFRHLRSCVMTLHTCFLACLITIPLPDRAHAQSRHAFVAGIDAYDNLGPDKQLIKAIGDARAVGGALRTLGFSATAIESPRRSEFNRAWASFLGKVQPGDTVVMFFSGHGVQVGGLNYLLPRDVPKVGAGDEGLLRDESISLQKLLEDIKDRRPRLALIIVDACRDNPFATVGGRSIGGARGLTRHEITPEGTFVMLSAGAGETALDRLPGNDAASTSVYTRSLLPLISKPGLTLQEMAVQVRDDVRKLAGSIGHKQTPAYWDELTGPRVCLVGSCPVAGSGDVAPARPTPPASPPKQTPIVTVPLASTIEPKRGPLAQGDAEGIALIVEQAARGRDGVAITMQVRNTQSGRISVAYDASIRDPRNQYVTYAATLTTGDGQVCHTRSLGGLEELDLSTARNFGGAGFSKDRVDRALTPLAGGASLAVTLQFEDCPSRSTNETGRLMFVLHKLEGERLTKVNVPLAGFQIGR